MTEARINRRRAALLTVITALLLLHGCSTTPPDRGQADRRSGAADTESAYQRAALDWQKQAMQADPDSAGRLWVNAADAWVQAGEAENAQDALRWVDRSSLAAPDAARFDLVLADLAILNGRPDEAEILLQKAGPAIPASSKNRFDGLYERLIQQLSGPASREIAQASRKSDGMTLYDPAAAVEMMQLLEPVSTGELSVRAYNPRSERQFAGWLDLALVIRRNLVQPERIGSAVTDWKSRNPHHLLSGSQALDTWLRYRQLFHPPGRVAVILPDSGRLQAAGAAIRDGLLSAYSDQPGGAELLFFGTGDDPQSAIAAYFSALDAGVDWIIGPLRRESVEAMLNLAGLSTPVLALNGLPPGFIPPQGLGDRVRALSLSQDEEARAAALHAAASGYRNAILLAPESPWGERMAAAFEEEFLQGDRKIVAATRYLESQNDHGMVLQRALKIDESKARKRRLENTLQVSLEFEAVRRQDVDVIFMAASPTQARLIRPQLRFHEAGDIPVYATGRVYSGQPDPGQNRDLDGIRFPTTRWQLEHPERADIPGVASLRRGSLAALYALGMDAWNLLPWLGLMNSDPGFQFTGQSGAYYDTRTGTLYRQPEWAIFANGRPTVLTAADTAGRSR